MRNSNKRQNGFTLIELMISIAIFAILAAMAVPSFNGMIMTQNLKSSTDTLVQEIKLARTKAILEKQEVRLNLSSSSSNTYNTLNWMPDGKVRLATPANAQLIFNDKGFLSSFSSFQDIELCKTTGATNSKKITLNNFGQIANIQDGSCT